MEKDIDKDGVVHYTEFIAATLEARGHVEEGDLAEAFYLMDVDKAGHISESVSL